MDKLDRLGVEGVRQLLGKGRKDESGDFTEGVGLDDESIQRLMVMIAWDRFKNVRRSTDTEFDIESVEFDESEENVKARRMADPKELLYTLHLSFGYLKEPQTGIAHLSEMQRTFEASGYGPDRIRIDPSLVRGLEYYTGPVYECELLFPVTNEKGEEVVFGSVAGGGRYDGLVKRFTGQDVPATGFSIGVSRLMTALKNLGKLDTDVMPAPVIVCVMDRDAESIARYQKMATELRQADIRAEMYVGGSGMRAQMKYADRRGAPCVVIAGEDEFNAGTITIKDLIEGAAMSEHIKDNAQWRSGRPAQLTVPREELVATVAGIISRHRS